ncbi:MAG: cytochrome c3 family protein [Deltaproteobacteria bacterium]|nr:cytochrome c3 family protein [Deltaproteobacteria bacterium]MBW2218166.1 cytochrome c3 family protein [Deltaproteobacteria bacterium]
MKKIVLFLIGLTMFCTFAVAGTVADQTKGAKELKLNGGSKGEVSFTHFKHQERLGDCNICHSFFPKSPGAVEALKQKGDLKKKHIMNKLCIKCHKAEKKAGKSYGPVTCSKCHIRK